MEDFLISAKRASFSIHLKKKISKLINQYIGFLYHLLVFEFFSSLSIEKCNEDDLGSVGSSCGKHKAKCGQTGGKPSAEQHAQHQYRTYKSQHTGSDTSKCFLITSRMSYGFI